MTTFSKIRWRIEKYIFDPFVRFYLYHRYFEKNFSRNNERVFIVNTEKIREFPAKEIFQFIISSNQYDAAYTSAFEKAYQRGFQNDPFGEKEYIRYRVFMNALIASMANKVGGDYCTVGVSWGVVPRTIYEFLNLKNTSNKYYLVDKWDKSLFSDSNVEQPVYCGDFEFIKQEFSEKNFQLIREFAPAGCNKINSRISFLHLNTGDRASEMATIEYLWDQITTPGFILIDNYKYSSDKNYSFDTLLQSKSCIVLPLGNGQGLILKI